MEDLEKNINLSKEYYEKVKNRIIQIKEMKTLINLYDGVISVHSNGYFHKLIKHFNKDLKLISNVIGVDFDTCAINIDLCSSFKKVKLNCEPDFNNEVCQKNINTLYGILDIIFSRVEFFLIRIKFTKEICKKLWDKNISYNNKDVLKHVFGDFYGKKIPFTKELSLLGYCLNRLRSVQLDDGFYDIKYTNNFMEYLEQYNKWDMFDLAKM